jgi:hypothetical protein
MVGESSAPLISLRKLKMAVKQQKKLVLGFSPYEYPGDIAPFDEVFTGGTQNIKEYGFNGVDAVILWGGTDIPPQWYGQLKHHLNGAPALPSERDHFEKKVILYCKGHNIPLIGICRGAQLLCVMAGGSLVQHVDGHGYDHGIDLLGNRKNVKVTSTHHQMMFPYRIPHTLVGWTETPRASIYEDGDNRRIAEMYKRPEPEIVYFPQLKGLAIQGHPEYGHASNEFRTLVNDLVNEYLFPAF